MSRGQTSGIVAAAGVVVAVALLAWGGVVGQQVTRGYLCAFVLVSMIPIGSLALLLAHGISGGRWGGDLAPVLVPAARCMPLLFVAVLPVLLLRPAIYDWAQLHLEPDVTAYYLNPPFFDARTLLALAIWSALAWTGAWRRQLFAALGLAAHLVMMTFIPADWVLTIQPGFVSAGFGMGFGIEQMFAALAFAAVLTPQGRDPRANRDLAGLLVTTLLGTTYFLFMQFLVTWYGNIPDKVKWYAPRAHDGWSATVLAAFLIGVALPFLAILNPYVRREPGALRIVGALVLCGICLHVAWLTAPAFGAAALIPAALAVLAMALLIAAVVRLVPAADQGGVRGG